MPDITLSSSTDTQEAVNAALGIEPEVAPEVKEPEKPEPKPEKTEQAEESETPAEEEVEEPEDKPEDQPKKKGGFQRRIDKLTEEKYQLQGRTAELERQLALRSAEQPNPEQPKPEATGEPKADDFDSYEKYIRAVAKWDLKQELAQERREQAKQAEAQRQAAKQAEFQKKTEAVRAEHEDFDEVVNNPNIRISPAMREVILDSDQAAAIAYYLGKNPDDAARISVLSPIAAARELGKLEAKIQTPVTSTQEVKPKVTTAAPAPIKPVGQKPAPSSKKPDDMDFQEYKKWRESNK